MKLFGVCVNGWKGEQKTLAYARKAKRQARRKISKEIEEQVYSNSFEALQEQDAVEMGMLSDLWMNDIHVEDYMYGEAVLPAGVSLTFFT